jgi:hypothetical protein
LRFETSGRLLLIDEPDKFENNWLRFESLRTLPIKVKTPYHDNDLILPPIKSPQSGWH